MAWHDDLKHPFAGIAEKLKRTDENIGNLNREIDSFFAASKYPVIPDPDAKEWQEAVNYHRNLAIPVRFAVLCGEVVHHLRSCLDHVAWYFSGVTYRRDHENAIGFPVLVDSPSTKDEFASYNRKIKGITNANVSHLIGQLQPYQRGNDAISDPLCIVHDMDRFDKHRELVIIISCANVTFPPGTILDTRVIDALSKHSKGEAPSPSELAVMRSAIKKNAKVAPQIAFAEVGKWKSQPVIPVLTQLSYAIRNTVDIFAGEV